MNKPESGAKSGAKSGDPLIASGAKSGGALIASGEHGCVFDKFPTCSKRGRTLRKNRMATSRKIAKIVSVSDESTDVEIYNSNILKHIPDYEDYFVLIDEVCESDKLPDGWQQCSIFKPGQQRLVTFVQLRMQYSGIRLLEYARDRRALINNWLRIQIHVAEGLQLLHKRNWIHGDLHHGNIVVDENNVARIIDFGQSFTIGSLLIKDINLTFLPSYDNYAPELDYVAGLASGFTKEETVNQIYTKKRILYKIDEVFPSQAGVLGDLQQFSRLSDIENDNDIIRYIKTYAKPSDIWALGYDFFNLYMDMLVDSQFTESLFYKRNHGEQMRVLRGMLHPDPRRRLSIDNLLNELYAMRMTWI